MEREVRRRRANPAGSTAIGLLLLALSAVSAQAEPPIRSQRDAQCRDTARARVFSTPDPANVGLHEIGRRLYAACMGRTANAQGKRRARRSR